MVIQYVKRTALTGNVRGNMAQNVHKKLYYYSLLSCASKMKDDIRHALFSTYFLLPYSLTTEPPIIIVLLMSSANGHSIHQSDNINRPCSWEHCVKRTWKALLYYFLSCSNNVGLFRRLHLLISLDHCSMDCFLYMNLFSIFHSDTTSTLFWSMYMMDIHYDVSSYHLNKVAHLRFLVFFDISMLFG